MPRRKSLPAILFLTLFFTGCGGAHWTKPGADDATAAADEQACRNEVQRRMGPIDLPAAGGDPRFGPPMGGSQSDRMMQAAQDTGRCMRGKGYTLTPDGG